MFDSNSLRTATIVGTALQLAMVVAGHFVPYVALHVFMFGGMAISLLAGLIFGRAVAGFGAAAVGGAIAGGVCALLGIAVSVVLGDTLAMILALGTVSSAITGAIGGVIGCLIGGRRPASA